MTDVRAKITGRKLKIKTVLAVFAAVRAFFRFILFRATSGLRDKINTSNYSVACMRGVECVPNNCMTRTRRTVVLTTSNRSRLD